MAQTITSYFDDDDGYIQLTLTETASSVEDNKSTWTAVLKFIYTQNVSSSASKSYSMTINGTSYSGTFTIGSSSSGVTKTLKTVTGISVSHNTDGSKSFSVSFSVGVNLTLSGTYYGTITGSGTVTATTIARATVATLSSSSVNLGSSVTISLPRASTSFTHKIEQNVSGSYVTLTSSAGTSYTLTADTSWGSYFPSATSKTVTIRITTYSGSTQIGSSMTLTLTVKITSTMVPTISSITATEATSGLASAFGAYIQSKSTLKIVTSAAGIYGSTIKTCAVTFNGNSYSGATVTTNAITSSGTLTITVKVTDTRGKTATSTTTVSVLAYSNPSISAFNPYRCDADGNVDANGTSLTANAAFDITSLNDLNSNTYKLQYRIMGTTSWTTLITSSGYSFDGVLNVLSNILDVNNSYDVRLTVTDYFTSISFSSIISTAFTLMNFTENSVAIGKMSEVENTFEVGLDSIFYGGLMVGDIDMSDMVGGSTYVKLPDGTLICHGNSSFDNTNGIDTTTSVEFAVPFTALPKITMSIVQSNTSYFGIHKIYERSTTGFSAACMVLKADGTVYGGSSATFCWMAVGRWK